MYFLLFLEFTNEQPSPLDYTSTGSNRDVSANTLRWVMIRQPGQGGTLSSLPRASTLTRQRCCSGQSGCAGFMHRTVADDDEPVSFIGPIISRFNIQDTYFGAGRTFRKMKASSLYRLLYTTLMLS